MKSKQIAADAAGASELQQQLGSAETALAAAKAEEEDAFWDQSGAASLREQLQAVSAELRSARLACSPL